MKRIAILTSSRADYSIYLPLLKALKEDPFFELNIIAFGTHLSHFHGYTLNSILNDGLEPTFQIETMMVGDSPNAISTAMALTSIKFADFWKDHHNDFDLVFCLGDRYEMFSSVFAGIPFNIPFAHIHGGEKTVGAIDNIFRHSISLASKYHFVSCKDHSQRVAELTESKKNIYLVGSLSLDNLSSHSILDKDEFQKEYGINLNLPTILVTLHPETVLPDKNIEFANEIAEVLLSLKNYQAIITLPNADTFGSVIRNKFLNLPAASDNRIQCFENLGTVGYFSAMKHCSLILGNSSSGIIEAASFNKWVINVGNRQKGRKQNPNIYNVDFNRKIIIDVINDIEKIPVYNGGNIYLMGNAAKNICTILKKIL